ncbi:MAG: multidrug ABC transporter permease, partial [Micrococcales bacterium]
AWKPTLVLSACFTASGLMFGSLAAVTAQLGSYARTASSLAVGLLGIGYVIRGYLDSSDSPDWVIWATPLGWLERTRPSTDNNGWPLLAALAFTVLMVVLAWTLQRRRDFGLGMIPARPGPANGGLVASVGGLAVRVNRGSLLTWLAAFAALGFVFGNLSASVGDLLAANPSIAAVIASGAVTETDLTFAFACTMLQITGILAAVTGVQVMMRLYVEESELRAEPVLAGALRRPTYLASHVVLALVASGVALLVTGTGVGLVVSTSDTGVQFGDVLAQAGATVPAAWVLVAVSVAAIGAHPGKRLVAWAAVVATFALTLLGPTFDLPNWALGISPLHHVPTVTAANPDWRSLVVLCGLVVLLGVVGFAGYRRRDIG